MQQQLIDWADVEIRRRRYEKGATIFWQGEISPTVLYIERGAVRLAVVSQSGKECIVGVLERGCFLGEGCLADRSRRTATATAVTPCAVVEIEAPELTRQLRLRPALAQRFLEHILARNIRIAEDLIDQLFNDAEKRLARTLLLMARNGEEDASQRILPRVSQTVLAETIGTTRSRVNAFMTKFRKLGFIEYNGQTTLKVNKSLLTVLR